MGVAFHMPPSYPWCAFSLSLRTKPPPPTVVVPPPFCAQCYPPPFPPAIPPLGFYQTARQRQQQHWVGSEEEGGGGATHSRSSESRRVHVAGFCAVIQYWEGSSPAKYVFCSYVSPFIYDVHARKINFPYSCEAFMKPWKCGSNSGQNRK